MRLALAALLLLTSAAVAGSHSKDNNSGSSQSQQSAAAARGHVPATTPQRRGGHDRGGLPGVSNGIRRNSDRHHRGPDVWDYPYPPFPSTWPNPAYPYSQYYYPYPPPFYGNDSTSDDDQNSLHGMVVPGDLPMGQARAFWFYCDTPDGYYPYVKTCTKPWTSIPVSPPPPGMAKPVSYSDWQWCEETKSFFPYVASCREGFVPTPVTAPSGTSPQVANWYFCEDPKGYAPYVVQCGKDWRAVPAIPPPSVKVTVKDEKGATAKP